MDFTCQLITGERDLPIPEKEKKHIKLGRISEILQKNGHDPNVVAALIRRKFTKKPYMQQLIFGAVDADQLAFLITDSKFSGVNYGDISLDTISEFFSVEKMNDGKYSLYASEKAIPALKDMLMARISMYNFYLTDTGLVIGNMIQSAIKKAYELGELQNFYTYTDDELRTNLINSKDPFVSEMGVRIKYRELLKIAYKVKPVYSKTQMDFLAVLAGHPIAKGLAPDIMKEQKDLLTKLNELGEEYIHQRVFEQLKDGKITKDHIMLNMKSISNIELTEPRLKEAREIGIIKNGRKTTFGEVEPFFTLYLENAMTVPAVLYIAVPEEYRVKTKKIMQEIAGEL